MKRTLLGMVAAGEALLLDAIEATRAYHQAEAEGRPAKEVECLRMLADSLYHTVTDWQVEATNSRTLH
ncbi:hypothetical protein ODI84_04450 [Pseudomonas putida]|uniref:hypothetical protein n=1 Tax=Pseudomonas putida TaxID=303 RepID=UPI002D1E82D7|nr:hypothetical protein [Pseudomonas putida]MEB3899430.1 hypothetical protein [Pseudomonas putida]